MQTFSDLRGEQRPTVELPLFDAPTTVRTFDTPEFRGITFYEVEAKSILNRVPTSSRLGFEWTINVYRGCLHACSYCLSGDTLILMADGGTKPLADVRVGDAIYGTAPFGRFRQYVITTVLDHWSTVKPGYRITLEDGTELIASGDHRFLTDTGWKHVIGSRQCPLGRPHLTVGTRLPGPGKFLSAPYAGPEYRRGYLCGLIRGDGDLPSSSRRRPGRTNGDVHRSRLALADPEPLQRARTYLKEFGVGTDELVFAQATNGRKQIHRQVTSIEPLGMELPLHDLTTGTGDFIANGCVSHNCFARPTHTYLNMGAGEDFERKIVVKVNAPEVLRRELRKRSWKGAHVAMGTNTDPYQRCEGRYRLTRGVLEALRDYANPCSILTKSPLLLRDLDLFTELVETAGFAANLSIGTFDEEVWRRTEPGTPHPRARMEAVKKLNRAGVPTGVLVAPVLPGISDSPAQLKEVVRAAAEAGASHVSPIALHLRPGVKEEFMPWLEREYPELVASYRRLYRGSNAPKAIRQAISERVAAARRRSPPADPSPEPPPPRRMVPPTDPPAERGDQLSLLD